MSVVMMSGNGQQWLHLGQRESAILDAMLAWARAMAKTNPERIQIMEDGEKYIRSGGEHPRTFTVHRFNEGLPGIGWGSNDYWARKAGDWQLLFEDDRGTAMGEVRWATNELHGINTVLGIAPDATAGHQYTEIEELWREIGIPEDMIS